MEIYYLLLFSFANNINILKFILIIIIVIRNVFMCGFISEEQMREKKTLNERVRSMALS